MWSDNKKVILASSLKRFYMEIKKYSKSTISTAVQKYKKLYKSKEQEEKAESILGYCIDNNDYRPILKVYAHWHTTDSIKDNIAKSILEYCKNNNDYSLVVKLYEGDGTTARIRDSLAKYILEYYMNNNDYKRIFKLNEDYSTNNETKVKIAKSILEYCKKYNDYTLAFKLYKSNKTPASAKKIILQEILEYSKRNNDFTSVLKILESICFEYDNKYNNKIYAKQIIETIIKSNNHETIFYLYKIIKNIKVFIDYGSSLDNLAIVRRRCLLSSSEYKYYSLQDIVLDRIKKPDFIDIALILSLEAKMILQDYKKINFANYPEKDEALKLLIRKDGKKYLLDNYSKFFNYISKLLKSNKIILALHLLNNYSGYSTLGDAKLWVDKYIEAFVALNRYDILTKYYASLNLMNDNIEFLQHVTQYFIKEKKISEAKEAINRMEFLEPGYSYIHEAKKEIDNISLINQMLSMDIDIEQIDKLSGQEFEQLLVKQFQKLGYKTTETPKTGDFGADIILDTKDDTRFIIQCKRFKSRVNLKAVQEVVGALAHFNGDIGIVITSSSFLNSAIKLAQSNDIELWDNNRLMKFLSGDISFSQIATS